MKEFNKDRFSTLNKKRMSEDSVVEVQYEEVCPVGNDHSIIVIKPVTLEDLKDKSNDQSGSESTGGSNESNSGSPRVKLGRKITTKRRR